MIMGMEKNKLLGGNLPQYHFVNYKFHIDWPELHPGLHSEKLALNHLS